jgi:hypothetical protein
MVRIIPKLLRKDKRKYPILRNDRGKTARSRCFEDFDNGDRPAKVAKKEGISQKTAYQYHWQWKKLPKHLNYKYLLVKNRLKSNPKLRENIISKLSIQLSKPEYKIRLWLESPWGIKQLVSGKWGEMLKREKQIEKSRSFKAAMLIVDNFKYKGLTIDEILEAFQKRVDEKSKKVKE